MTEEEKKIIADDDWKNQARKEKEKLADKEKPQAGPQAEAVPGEQGPLPPASIMMLINSLLMQAMFYMGKLPDPNNPNERPEVNLELAKHHIDLLQVLEDKTKGNLSEDESGGLSMALHELRMLYVQVAS